MLGTFILWFGWYGFNPGSALILTTTLNTGDVAALAAVNTTISAATAGTTALFTNLFVEERTTGEAKFDLLALMNGCLGGLVAITAGCATVEPWAAFIIGLVAGWIYLLSSAALIRIRLDDAVNAIPVHLVCGTWGVFAVGLFSAPTRVLAAYGTDEHVGWFYELARGSFNASLLGCQVCAILFVLGWVFFIMFPFFIWLNYMGWFRADSLEELVGLDISYHGGSALGNDEVKLEYVEAFNRRKGEKAGGAPGGGGSRRNMQEIPSSYADNYNSQEEVAMEAMGEDDHMAGGMQG
jgi:Amt family ammonium transporter